MICTEAAEFASALCDGEIISPVAAEHIGTCPACKARLCDYLAMGVELRRVASLEQSAAVPVRAWERPQNPLTAFLQKGWGTMRIPRLAFAALIAGIIALGSTLAVVKVGAHDTGTVLLLSTAGPTKEPFIDCPLDTLDKNQASCMVVMDVGQRLLQFKVSLLSRDGHRVLLGIRTRSEYKSVGTHSYSPFELDNEPAREVWLEPGEPVRFDVPDVGALTLSGEWLDHMPILVGKGKQDLSPAAGEVRFASPLMLKDNRIVGDLSGAIGGVFSTDSQDWASAIYLPGEGRFLIAQVPMKGAVEAHVATSRISFDEGGHRWEIANGVPVTRADHLWILHQPEFKPSNEGQSSDGTFGNCLLLQTSPGIWEPSPGPK
jgi:hypothetical protein